MSTEKQDSTCDSCNILGYQSRMWEVDGFYYCFYCYYKDIYEEEEEIKINKEQYQFTISEDIANQLNNINASEYESLVDRFVEDYEDYSLSEKLIEFSSKNPYNYHLCILYLVGEELGKRMVEVVE